MCEGRRRAELRPRGQGASPIHPAAMLGWFRWWTHSGPAPHLARQVTKTGQSLIDQRSPKTVFLLILDCSRIMPVTEFAYGIICEKEKKNEVDLRETWAVLGPPWSCGNGTKGLKEGRGMRMGRTLVDRVESDPHMCRSHALFGKQCLYSISALEVCGPPGGIILHVDACQIAHLQRAASS